MNLYEFINISDTITFWASDDDVAIAAAAIVGNGHSGCDRIGDDGKKTPILPMYILGGMPKETIEKVMDVAMIRREELKEAMRTFACCRPQDREAYDVYTENSTNQDRWDSWDDKHRTSLNNYCKWARDFRFKEQPTEEVHKKGPEIAGGIERSNGQEEKKQ